MRMTVDEVMRTKVFSVPAEATAQQAAEVMREHGIGFLPVLEAGKVIGVLTDRDIVVRSTARGDAPDRTRVGAIATPEVIACGPYDSIAQVEHLMEQNMVRRLIVLDDERRPLGVVSLDDLATEPGAQQEAGDVLEHVVRPDSQA